MKHLTIGHGPSKGIESARQIERAVFADWAQRSRGHLQRFLFRKTLETELRGLDLRREFNVETIRPQAVEAIARRQPEWGTKKTSNDGGNLRHEARGGSPRARNTAGNESHPIRVVPMRRRREP
jgi:hypothetical protein